MAAIGCPAAHAGRPRPNRCPAPSPLVRSILFNYTILRDTKVRPAAWPAAWGARGCPPRLPHSCSMGGSAATGSGWHSMPAPEAPPAQPTHAPVQCRGAPAHPASAPHAPTTRPPRPVPAPQDVLVVTAPGSGAEIIPFLKTWVNLPMAIGFTVLYTKLANVLNNEQLFYTCIFPFIAFFGAFAFVLYPMKDALHPTGAATAQGACF